MPWTASRLAALAWVAGEIDTFGYLRLGHVFISHMTGNTAVLSIALAQRDVTDALHRGILIPLFFLGGLCGALLVDSADEPRQVSRALVVEAAAARIVRRSRLARRRHVRSIAWRSRLHAVAAVGFDGSSKCRAHTSSFARHTHDAYHRPADRICGGTRTLDRPPATP